VSATSAKGLIFARQGRMLVFSIRIIKIGQIFEQIPQTVHFSVSKDVDRVLEVLPEIVQKLRNMSPLTPKEYRTL
jgi:hypothetical protein